MKTEKYKIKTSRRNEVLKVNILLRVAFNNRPTSIQANHNIMYPWHIGTYTVYSTTHNMALPSIIRERDMSPLFMKSLSLSHTPSTFHLTCIIQVLYIYFVH